jgi:hypothetical protein
MSSTKDKDKELRDQLLLFDWDKLVADPSSAVSGRDWLPDNSTCRHEWAPYTGFTESYWYCKLCDKKKEGY